MTPLLDLADAELAQLIATSALLPVEKRAVFVQRVAAALAAGETSLLNAITAAQRQAEWFQCGYCGRRVVRLYIVQAVFACRHCHRLGHASQLETPHERGTGRARKIRMRLSDGTDDPQTQPPQTVRK